MIIAETPCSVREHHGQEQVNGMNIFAGIMSLIMVPLFFAFMELTAWVMHKYVMHGFLWMLHEDHHRYHERWLEKNDAFTLLFSLIAIILLYWGTHYGVPFVIGAGMGVTLYGICYFLFHDIMFHRRIKFFKLKPGTRYLKRIVSPMPPITRAFIRSSRRLLAFYLPAVNTTESLIPAVVSRVPFRTHKPVNEKTLPAHKKFFLLIPVI